MKFDPQEGYINDDVIPKKSTPLVYVCDHAAGEIREIRLDEAYTQGFAIAALKVTPITMELLEAVENSLEPAAWNTDCQKVVKNELQFITRSHLIAATKAPDPFVYIASFAYQAAKLAPKGQGSALLFYQYLARVVTVYLKSHGYYMPDIIYPILYDAIGTTSATRIDKVVKGLHIQIAIGSFEKYINNYVQLHDGQEDIISNKRIAIEHALPLAKQLSVTDKNEDPDSPRKRKSGKSKT